MKQGQACLRLKSVDDQKTVDYQNTLPFNLLAFGWEVKLAQCLIIDRFLVKNYNIGATDLSTALRFVACMCC